MATVKVVVTGPFAAGKTTFIRTVSEIAVISTERNVTDQSAAKKGRTTVAMDFGRITIDESLVLYLFGTPGQERFDFMWEILSEGMLGFILLLDPVDKESFEDARKILNAFLGYGDVPFVVAVNKHDDDAAGAAIARAELALADSVPIVPVDARDLESVKGVLLELLLLVMKTRENQQVLSPG